MNTTHPSPTSGTSQANAILARLQADPGEWVSLIDLWKASGSMAVHSRINDLRQRGHHIDHHNEPATGTRKLHSFYKLVVPSPGAAPSRPSIPTQNQNPNPK